MKNYQFCMLMATIYVAPLTSPWLNVVATGVFLAGGAFEMIKGR